MKRMIDFAVYLIVRMFICVMQALPLSTGVSIARLLAWLFADVLRARRRLVRSNLAHAFPEWTEEEYSRCIRRMWEHLFLLIIEVAHVPRKLHDTNWRDFVELDNIRPLVTMLLSDRPHIMVTGHFGNFEVGGYMLGLFGFPTYSVARTLDNPYLHDFITRFRGATGQYLISKNGGAEPIQDVIEQGDTLAFLADQAAGPKGCWVDFFGRQASTYKAIALLGMTYETPITVVYARRRANAMEFEMAATETIDPAVEDCPYQTVKQITQWYTHQLEAAIRETPGQYWWIHKRWKDYGRDRNKKKQTKATVSKSSSASESRDAA